MKRSLIFTIVLGLLFLLAACSSVAEQVSETVLQEAAERLVEQATGIEITEMDAEEGIVAFSVGTDDGSQIDVAMTETAAIDQFEGMGFTIPLPNGLAGGMVQNIQEDGEDLMVQASYELADISGELFVSELHETLIGLDFSYVAFLSGNEEPDIAINPMINYTHPDGYQLMLIIDDSATLISLIKTSPEAVAEMQPQSAEPALTTFSGTMQPDKSAYAPGEEIRLTFVSNDTLDDWAWVGIVPRDTPQGLEEYGDAAYLSYTYTSYVEDGLLIMYAPDAPGEYDLRLYNAGLELASVSIQVNN